MTPREFKYIHSNKAFRAYMKSKVLLIRADDDSILTFAKSGLCVLSVDTELGSVQYISKQQAKGLLGKVRYKTT